MEPGLAVERRSGSRGVTKTANKICRRKHRRGGRVNTWLNLLTSETPLARRALISSSLSSGQAMGEVEVRVMR